LIILGAVIATFHEVGVAVTPEFGGTMGSSKLPLRIRFCVCVVVVVVDVVVAVVDDVVVVVLVTVVVVVDVGGGGAVDSHHSCTSVSVRPRA
jgi:hypothetical protein